MTIARRVFASLENPQVPVSSDEILSLFGGEATHAGVKVTEQKALGLPAVWRAVNVIAGSAAALPLHAYRPESDVRMKVSDGKWQTRLLDEPHPWLSSFEFWEIVYAHLLLWGNAYILPVKKAENPTWELWPIHPSRVRVGLSRDGAKVFEIDGGVQVLVIERSGPQSPIIHIPGFGYDGILGLSPITLARQGVALALAAEDFGARFFGNGSLATGILKTDQRLSAEQADNLQTRWKAKRAGLDKAHETIVLDSGATFTQLTIPPEDAQFLQTRSFQVSEIARIFGVPPHMLMDTEKSTSWGTGIESQAIGFVTYTLRPWLTRVEQQLTRWLSPNDVYVRYGVEGLLRGDSSARAAFYTQLWNLGVLSTNEIRALEERPPVEGGDVRYRPLNMGVLGQADDAESSPTGEAA